MKLRIYITLGLILAMLMAAVPQALAHKVIVFAWVEDGIVHVEGGFGGKRPARDCKVIVLDDKDQVVHQGMTSEEGRHEFPLPRGNFSRLTIVLEAGPGHKGDWTLEGEDLKPDKTTSTPGETEAERPEELSGGPSPFKIAGGIAMIFALALGARFLSRRKKTP